MGGKASGKTYVSKGQRPNVARWLRNALRRDRRANPSVESVMARRNARDFVMGRKEGKYAVLRERYTKEAYVESVASQLYDQYAVAGATWGACVQAAKTDWVSSFHAKWGDKLRALKDSGRI